MNDLRRLWAYGQQVRGRLIGALVLGIAASGAAIGLTSTAAFLISKASQQPPILTLSVAIVAVRFFGISRGVARYAERVVGHDAAFGVLGALRADVYRKLERLVPSGVSFYRSGDLLSRFVNDVDTSQELFLRVVPPYVIALVLGIGTSILVAWILPLAGVFCGLGLLLAALLVPWLSVRSSQRAEATIAAQRSTLSLSTLQLVDVMPELIVADTVAVERDKVAAAYADLRRTETRMARGTGVGSGLGALLVGLTVVGCLVVGIAAVNDGRLDGVLLAVVVLTPMAAFDVTAPLPAAYQQWLNVRGAAHRVFDLVDTEPTIVEPVAPLPAPEEPALIEVRDVNVRWPGSDTLALRDYSFAVRAGERIAIVGPSGSGKSTTAALLLGFLQPDEGVVRWDGIDVQRFATDDLRTHIGLLTQDGYLFDSTMEQNLRIGKRDATLEELREALRSARLLDWVDQLPEGLSTPVGEHGSRLSGGQRQRLCLARLLLADFPVTVFDEPGEHLDTETAEALMADLLTVTAGRTSVLITHRLSGLESVDQIVVLNQGQVSESGSHDELLAAGGWYATNWEHEQARLVIAP